MSVELFQRASDIHLKIQPPHRVVRCHSDTHWMLHGLSRALHQSFLPESTQAVSEKPGLVGWHIYTRPTEDKTDFHTTFRTIGPLKDDGTTDIRKLLESYDREEEPGYHRIDRLVTEIRALRIPFQRHMTFNEKTQALIGLQAAAKNTMRRYRLDENDMVIKSLVSVCPEGEFDNVNKVAKKPTYNIWVTMSADCSELYT